MLRRIAALFAFLVLMLPGPAFGQSIPPGLKVPPGFEVTEYAGPELATDIYCMTLDPKGRVVVSGRGYIKILVEDQGTGKADRAILFADTPKDGAMGLFWEGNSLYVTGDGGLRRFKTADGDKAAGPSELVRKLKTGSEHLAHAITRGPDGWLYVLCGDGTGIDKSYAELPTSPVKDPVGGCVIRFSPDLKKSEIVADGFRNAYGFDFNADGELFTWDSDNERCVSLPWYEGTRFYHVIPGGNYGWMAPQICTTWRKPPYFLDVVAPILDLGRGSPTGVTCYRHVQFPEKYRGGFFLCDWTFGKVWFLRLTRSGSSYKAEKELFLEATGDNGFAPTACYVHPETGDLYISVGGRGTRGAVYRVRYQQGVKGASAKAAAKWQPAKRSLEWRPGLKKELVTSASSNDQLLRLNALNGICRHQQQFTREERLEAVKHNWSESDRYLRRAASEVLRTLGSKECEELLDHRPKGHSWSDITLLHALASDRPDKVVRWSQRILDDSDHEQVLAAARLVQLALGDIGEPRHKGTIWEGYTPRLGYNKSWERLSMATWMHLLTDLHSAWLDAEKHGWLDVQREVGRSWALVYGGQGATSSGRELLFSKPIKGGSPADQLHNLIIVSCLSRSEKSKGSAKESETLSELLLSIGPELEKNGSARERNWFSRMSELHGKFAKDDPDFNAHMLKHPKFVRADHVLFTKTPGFDRKKAAALFLAKVQDDPQFPWSADLVTLLGELPPEKSLPLLRSVWGKTGFDAIILPILARDPQPDDRSKFIDGLSSPQVSTVRLCLDALRKLPAKSDANETVALLRALGDLPDGKETKPLRESIAKYLVETTGQNFGPDRAAWLKWFAKVEPKLAAKLTNPDGVDVAAWDQRLAKVDWSTGDAGRGKAVYAKANCNACHNGPTTIGPTLAGVANRFSREDVLTAILQPSKDVSPRFQTTVIETTGGKLYQGIIVYEALDSVILVTGPAQNVRLAGSEIASKRTSRISLMPAGLLDNLLDQEIADLYAYLKSLK